MTDPEFREAYGRHKDVLYRFALRMTGSGAAAEDLVHDCFVALLKNPAAYDIQRGSLRSFLIGVTRNLALKRLRGERAWDELGDDSVAICEPFDTDGEERAEIVAPLGGIPSGLPAARSSDSGGIRGTFNLSMKFRESWEQN